MQEPMTDIYTTQNSIDGSSGFNDDIIPIEVAKLMEMLNKLENLTPPMPNEQISSIVAI